MMTMMTSSRFAPIPLVLLLALAPMRQSTAQQLALSVSVRKEVFFEGEPIYAAFRLNNQGPDTAWTSIFQLAPDRLDASLKRSDGSVVPPHRIWVDYAFFPGWRGVPIPPGESKHLLVVLQSIVGDPVLPTWTMFPRKIGVGTYTLAVTFHAAVEGAPTALPEVVASPVRLEVRPRTPQEDRSFAEVEQLLSQGWNRNTRAGYFPKLMALIRARLAQDSMDPFASFLVTGAVAMGNAWGLAPSSSEVAALSAARLEIARKQRFEPAGAMAAVSLSFEPEPPADLAAQLGPSLAQDVVKSRERGGRVPSIRPGRPHE
jgi:hypothetical protein